MSPLDPAHAHGSVDAFIRRHGGTIVGTLVAVVAALTIVVTLLLTRVESAIRAGRWESQRADIVNCLSRRDNARVLFVLIEKATRKGSGIPETPAQRRARLAFRKFAIGTRSHPEQGSVIIPNCAQLAGWSTFVVKYPSRARKNFE